MTSNQKRLTSPKSRHSSSVNRRILTAENRVRSQERPYGICGEQGGIRAEVCGSLLVFLCQHHCKATPNLHIHRVKQKNRHFNCD